MPEAEDSIHQLGKGALESPPDPRDLQLEFIAGAPASIDWSKPFILPEPPDSNQSSSDCCVAEATSYFHWQLKRKQFSVRSVFAYIAEPMGAYLKDGPGRVVSHGQETYEEAPDPNPKGKTNMRSMVGLNPADALDDQALRYFKTGGSADQLAQAVRDWDGAILGLYGNDRGWVDRTNPRPPVAGESSEWAHAIYAFGYHMHDGMKCIIAKSSWCRNINGVRHHEHHIKENYFASGFVFTNAYVMVPKENLPVYNRYIVLHQPTGRLGVLVVGQTGFGDPIVWAKSEAAFAELKKQFEVPDNAPRITLPA